MNAARLARRWQEASGDPSRMAEALVDEINDPATGLVTRDFLRAELAELRSDTSGEFGRVRGEIAQLRSDMSGEFGRVRGEIAQLRSDMSGEFGRVRAELAELRSDMNVELGRVREELARLETRVIWRTGTLFGAQIALVGLLVAALLKLVR
jgi:hypothetical protein